MKKQPGKNYLYSLIVFAIALVLRLINVFSIGDNYYANQLSDASTYRLWATKLVAGASYGDPAFQMGPLYPYFLAMNLSLGISLWGILIIQAILGSLTVLCIYHITLKVFENNFKAFLSGLAAAVFAPFIFYDGLILSESLQLTLISISLLLLIDFSPKRVPIYRIIIAGVLIGLASLGRATILIFAILLIAYWLIKWHKSPGAAKTEFMKIALYFAIGCVIGILPATIHNIINGEFVAISTNSGINLYIGNNTQANGSYEEPPGLNLSSDFTGRKIAERSANRTLRGSEVSEFWFKRTLKDIVRNPIHFVSLILKKAWLYFWHYEIPQAESLPLHREFSPLFKIWLPAFGFIFILTLISLLNERFSERKLIILLLFASSFLGNLAFFVIGRYRLIGYITLLVFSGAGIMAIYEISMLRKYRAILISSLALIMGILILYLPRSIDLRSKQASAYDNVGIYHFLLNRPEASITWYRKALEIMPDHSATLNNLGAYFYTIGMADSAQYYFRKSLAIDSTQDKTLMNLGKIARDRGDLGTAFMYYRKAKQFGTFNAEIDLAIKELEQMRFQNLRGDSTEIAAPFDNLLATAEKLSAQGKFRDAEVYFRMALHQKPNDIRALNNLGYAFQGQNKYKEAAECFHKVLIQSPENAIAYNNLASIIYQMGMLDSALVLWSKGLKLDPSNQQIKNNYEFVKKQKAESNK